MSERAPASSDPEMSPLPPLAVSQSNTAELAQDQPYTTVGTVPEGVFASPVAPPAEGVQAATPSTGPETDFTAGDFLCLQATVALAGAAALISSSPSMSRFSPRRSIGDRIRGKIERTQDALVKRIDNPDSMRGAGRMKDGGMLISGVSDSRFAETTLKASDAVSRRVFGTGTEEARERVAAQDRIDDQVQQAIWDREAALNRRLTRAEKRDIDSTVRPAAERAENDRQTEQRRQHPIAERMAAGMDAHLRTRPEKPALKDEVVAVVNITEARARNPHLSPQEAALKAYFEQMGGDINNIPADIIARVWAVSTRPSWGTIQGKVNKQLAWAPYGLYEAQMKTYQQQLDDHNRFPHLTPAPTRPAMRRSGDFMAFPNDHALRQMFTERVRVTGRHAGDKPEVTPIQTNVAYDDPTSVIVKDQIFQLKRTMRDAFAAVRQPYNIDERKFDDPRFVSWVESQLTNNHMVRGRAIPGGRLPVGTQLLMPSVDQMNSFLASI